MAKAVWGLELGTSSIKAVRMAPTKDGVELTALDVIELRAKDDDLEESHEDRLRESLIEFKERYKVKGDDIWISIPGHQTFNRLISLPYLDPKKFKETVQFEAQQQMPVKMEDIIWDYQMVDKNPAPGEDTQVSLFAVRTEIIQSFLDLMAGAGLPVTGIQVAPLAIYNFMKFDQRKFGKIGIIVDIGADNTDLVIIDETKVWIRNVPSGGSAITRTLQERFKVPYEEAEKLKIKAAKSKQFQKIFAVMKPALREMLGEIHRSVGFYKSQHPGVKLNNMMLMGSGSHLLGLKKFFEQNLQYSVDKLSRLNRIQLAKSADPSVLHSNIVTMAVSLGLAIQGCGEGANEINLIPHSIKVRQIGQQLFPRVLVASILMALFALMPLIHSGAASGAAGAASHVKTVDAQLVANTQQFNEASNVTAATAELTRYESLFTGADLERISSTALRALRADPEMIELVHGFNSRFRPFGVSGEVFLAADTEEPHGYLDSAEFTAYAQENMNYEEVRVAFADVDTNADGYISWFEASPRSTPLLVQRRAVDRNKFTEMKAVEDRPWKADDLERSSRIPALDPAMLGEGGEMRHWWFRGRVFGQQETFAVPVDLDIDYSEAREMVQFRSDLNNVIRRRLAEIVIGVPGNDSVPGLLEGRPIVPTLALDVTRLLGASLEPAEDLARDGVGGGNYLRVTVAIQLVYVPVRRGLVTKVEGDEVHVLFSSRFDPAATDGENPLYRYAAFVDGQHVAALVYQRTGATIDETQHRYFGRFDSHVFVVDPGAQSSASVASMAQDASRVVVYPIPAAPGGPAAAAPGTAP